MGELLSDPQYSGQRSARFWELTSPSLKWAHVWQPKWTVHSSYLRVPTNPWPVSEGKGLTMRLKKGRRGSRTHELYLGHLWACQFSPTSHLLIFGRAQTLSLSSHSTRWKRENWSRSLGTRARLRRACAFVPRRHGPGEPASISYSVARSRARAPGRRLRRRTRKLAPRAAPAPARCGLRASRPEGEEPGRWRLWWKM